MRKYTRRMKTQEHKKPTKKKKSNVVLKKHKNAKFMARDKAAARLSRPPNALLAYATSVAAFSCKCQLQTHIHTHSAAYEIAIANVANKQINNNNKLKFE